MAEALYATCTKLYLDNFFTGIDVMKILRENHVLATGTIRSNRRYLPKDLSLDKQMKRGDSDARQHDGVFLVKWMDNRSVLLVSTACRPDASSDVERRQKGSQEKVKVLCPDMVKEYNRYMGGVDLMDHKLVSYGLDMRARIKFYFRPFFDLMNIGMNNSYVVWSRLNPTSKMKALEFRRHVTRSMIVSFGGRERATYNKHSKKRGAEAHVGNIQHLPSITDVRRRCRSCFDKGLDFKTDVTCAACHEHR